MLTFYTQITDRCNMQCSHCCFNCTATGEDMSYDDFHHSLALVSSHRTFFTIGGGEPTLHPRCMDFVWAALRHTFHYYEEVPGCPVHIVTNGTNTEAAIELAQLAQKGWMYARLSYDSCHDIGMVEDRVHMAFRKETPYWNPERQLDRRAISSHLGSIILAGRAWENQLSNVETRACPCSGYFIAPSGMIYTCGCKVTEVGHVSKWKTLHIESDEDPLCANGYGPG